MFDEINGIENIPDSWKWERIKYKRMRLIVKYEWALLDHATITPEKKEQAEIYIQALKDIPQIYDLPDDVVFPDVPQFLLDWERGL